MITTYDKFFAAIISVFLTRWALRYAGLDINQLGLGDQLQGFVSLAIDSAAAGTTGFVVWLVPNLKKEL